MSSHGTPIDTARQREPHQWWHLIYLATLVFQPLLAPGSGAVDWAVAAGLAAAGVVLFVIGERGGARTRFAALLAFALLGTAGVWFNGGASVFFVYAGAYAGLLEPRIRAQRWLLGLVGWLVVLFLASPIPLVFRLAAFGFPLAFVWIVGSEVMHDVDREREWARLRIDNARTERLATLGERERIARDLHDLLGHTLTGILVRAQLIRKLTGSDPERVAREAADIEEIARDALAEVRATVSGWRHHALDVELEAARDALAATDVALTVDQDPSLSLSPAVEAALALAVREAVTNVVRHATADRCMIGIVSSGEQVRLTVADDGIGGTAPDGAGLVGMRERIMALGGRVDRRVTGGTTLTVIVPGQGVTT